MNRRAKIIIGIGAAFVVVILISVIHHYQLRAEVNAYIAQLKAKGELLDLAQVIPPPVPPDQNGAPLLLKAALTVNSNWNELTLIPPPMMQIVAPGKAMIGWQQPDIRNWGLTNSWDNLQKVLEKDKEALNGVRQITDRPQIDFNLNYTDGLDKLPLGYFESLNHIAFSLASSAVLKLHHGDTTGAATETHVLLLMANALQHERGYWPSSTRRSITYRASEITWEILQATNVSGEQLAELQQDWMSLDFIQSETEMLRSERAMDLIMVEDWRKSGARLEGDIRSVSAGGDDDIIDDGSQDIEPSWNWDRLKFRIHILFWQYWGSYPDELEALKCYDILINTAEAVQANGSFFDALQLQNQRINVSEIFKGRGNESQVMLPEVVALGRETGAFMSAEATKRVVVAAIALKRYQLKSSYYPTSLSQLVPGFLSAVPLDPVDGNPLRYRLNANGAYLLYSVGSNGKDDGGDPSLGKSEEGTSSFYWLNPRALDWVWPQVASPEEVEDYSKHLGDQSH